MLPCGIRDAPRVPGHGCAALHRRIQGKGTSIQETKLNRPVRTWCPVTSKERVADNTYWLELEAPEIAETTVPGQFMMIGFGVGGYAVPFLPRPNSIAAARDGSIGLLIRVFGEGSRRLSTLRRGDQALVLAPLGVGFDLGEARSVLCLAGGVGLAPFIVLPGWARRTRPETEITLRYGEREAAAVFDPGKLRELTGLDARIVTEDGSLGEPGRVTGGLELGGVDLVLACGPTAMLRAAHEVASSAGIPCQVAVEEHMACGMGTCIGCVVRTIDPETGEESYTRSCIDGPVFPSERLAW